jgi:4-amino-4-deoxy-L-arabinose transferase-like glycosyltransferase
VRLLQWFKSSSVTQPQGSGNSRPLVTAAWHFASLAISLLLLSYVTYRAANLSFVHDESLSFTIIKGDPTFKGTANHHPLNTWLMWVFSRILGDSEFSVRLPNLLAFTGYLAAAYLIFRRETNGWLALTGMCILLFNPFMLDFFGLARGYGISLGFILMTVYLLLRIPETVRPGRYFVFATGTAAGALMANLATINFYIAVLCVMGVLYYQSGRNRPRFTALQWMTYLLIVLLPLAWAIRKLLFLKAKGELYVGAASLTETFSSIIDTALYRPQTESGGGSIACGGMAAALIFCLIFLLIKRDFRSPLFIVTALLTLVFSGLLAEHYMFGVNYPMERTALYLLPLLGLFLYYLVARGVTYLVHQCAMPAWATLLIFGVIAGPLTWNLVRNGNLQKTYTWEYDAGTKKAAERLRSYINENAAPGESFTVSNNWSFEPTLNLYIRKLQLPIAPATREGLNEEADFIYTGSRDIYNPQYILLEEYPVSGAKLYARVSM